MVSNPFETFEMKSHSMLATIENFNTSLERATPLAASRLSDVAGFLRADLLDVEAIIAETALRGERPGTLASAHLQTSGGKRIRPMLVMLSAMACGGQVSSATKELAAVAELVHMATLLHDDVLDDASERRGLPVARRVFGNAVSVLAGDLLLVNSLERAQRADNVGFHHLLETLRHLVNGEIVQLRGRTVLDTTLATYERIVSDKTASLFAWAGAAGARSANADGARVSALAAFGTEVGVAFQVIDDMLDYVGDSHATGKALHADLHEGKITLPLVFALEQMPSLHTLIERVRAGEDEAASAVADAVREANVLPRVKAYARVRTENALRALAGVDEHPASRHLRTIAQELAERAS
jgi:octaprenyl-diphosphate synthase